MQHWKSSKEVWKCNFKLGFIQRPKINATWVDMRYSQGVSPQGSCKFTKKSSHKSTYFVKEDRIPLLSSLNSAKSCKRQLLLQFCKQAITKLIVFAKYFSLVKNWIFWWTFDLFFIGSSRYFRFEAWSLTASLTSFLCFYC